MNLKAPVSYVLFDLDNTLYHASSPMLTRINVLINRYIMDLFSLSWHQAQGLRRLAYKNYGTTLRWLQVEHGFTDTEHYLNAVHPEDAAFWIRKDLQPLSALRDLPVGKSVLTNSIREHAERVLDYLEIRDQFEYIYDIRFNNLISKPDPRAFTRVLEELPFSPSEVVFIDDNPAFLEPFAELGGQCILMDHLDAYDNVSFVKVRSIEACVEEIKKCCPYTDYKDSSAQSYLP